MFLFFFSIKQTVRSKKRKTHLRFVNLTSIFSSYYYFSRATPSGNCRTPFSLIEVHDCDKASGLHDGLCIYRIAALLSYKSLRYSLSLFGLRSLSNTRHHFSLAASLLEIKTLVGRSPFQPTQLPTIFATVHYNNSNGHHVTDQLPLNL